MYCVHQVGNFGVKPNTNKCKNTNSIVIELTDILGTLIKLHFLFYKSYIHSLYSQFLKS